MKNMLFNNYKVVILDASFCIAQTLDKDLKSELKNANVYVSNDFNDKVEEISQTWGNDRIYQDNMRFLRNELKVKSISPDIYTDKFRQDVKSLIDIFNRLNEKPVVLTSDKKLIEYIRNHNINADCYDLYSNQWSKTTVNNFAYQRNEDIERRQNTDNVRYCRICGRRLMPGEVCTCQTENQTNKYSNYAKQYANAGLKEYLNFLKKPVSTSIRLTNNGNHTAGTGLILAKGIICTAVVLIVILYAINAFNSGWSMSPYYDNSFPFKEIFMIVLGVLLYTIGLDLVESLFLKIISGAKNYCAALNATGSKAIYDTIFFLVIVLLLRLVPEFAVIVFMMFFSASTYIQLASFIASSPQDKKDRYVFVFIVVKIIIAIILSLIVYMFLRNVVTSALNSTGIPYLLRL